MNHLRAVQRILSRVRFDETASFAGTPCWIYAGRLQRGYGSIGSNCRSHRTHRLIYEASRGPIAPGMVLDHLCQTKACLNPFHLERCTPAENTRRHQEHRRRIRTHCKHGHPATEKNIKTYLRKRTRFRDGAWQTFTVERHECGECAKRWRARRDQCRREALDRKHEGGTEQCVESLIVAGFGAPEGEAAR
jgi:HNH endonuclease